MTASMLAVVEEVAEGQCRGTGMTSGEAGAFHGRDELELLAAGVVESSGRCAQVVPQLSVSTAGRRGR